MMRGIITKGIGGFYYVSTEYGEFECKARGILRKEKIKPLVGDYVEIDVLDLDNKKAVISTIFKRNTELLRPQVANITQVIIVFAWAQPEINLLLLDKFIVQAEWQKLKIIICLNKSDLIDEDFSLITDIYENVGYKVICTDCVEKQGIEILKGELNGQITTFAGTSGVGKTTIINNLIPGSNFKTGEISRKISRGKHTTRHSELIKLNSDTYLLDTPGFAAFDISYFVKPEELEKYYIEIKKYADDCRFVGCSHATEPDCAVRKQVGHSISKKRYENYINLYNELRRNS